MTDTTTPDGLDRPQSIMETVRKSLRRCGSSANSGDGESPYDFDRTAWEASCRQLMDVADRGLCEFEISRLDFIDRARAAGLAQAAFDACEAAASCLADFRRRFVQDLLFSTCPEDEPWEWWVEGIDRVRLALHVRLNAAITRLDRVSSACPRPGTARAVRDTDPALGPNEYAVLVALNKARPVRVKLADLEAETKLSGKTCGSAVNSLIDKGLAERETPRTGVAITAGGRALLTSLSPAA